MTDIVERLRALLKEQWPQEFIGIDDIREAADEIERLRRQLRLYAGVHVTEIREWPNDRHR